jgi:hypothetical protein
MTIKIITMPTENGDAEAVRIGPAHAVWEICYPWGAGRFYGTPAQVRALMRERIAEESAETEESVS